MPRKNRNRKIEPEVEYLCNLNDYTNLYNKMVDVRKGILKADSMMEHICKFSNTAAIKHWIQELEKIKGIKVITSDNYLFTPINNIDISVDDIDIVNDFKHLMKRV